MPKLSVVVPVYNVEKYLNQCIDSILGQSFTDFELILVDDGSTDRSGSICDEYIRIDSRVAVVHTENRGSVSARRTGVKIAHGEYTSCVDSDDWLDSDFYRDVFDAVGDIYADILICTHANRAAGCVKTTCIEPGYYERKELENTVFPQMMYDMSKERYGISPSLCMDKLFRTELLNEVYTGVDSRVTLGEDAVCTYPCIARANSILILDNRACYNYREDHVSMVNHCDIRLLQRVSVFATSMDRQFDSLAENFKCQVQCYVACVGLYAAGQVLLLNSDLRLAKRIAAVKDFFRQDEMAKAIKIALKASGSLRFKWKLILARIVSCIL